MSNDSPSWSPDGAWLAFISDRDDGWRNLWRVRPDGSELERLVAAERELFQPAWAPGGQGIAYIRDEDGDRQIWIWSGENQTQVTSAPGVHADPAWIDDERLVCLYESPAMPPDLWSVSTTGERFQLTFSVTGGVLGQAYAMPELVRWTSKDGCACTGLLYRPRELRPGQHPLIVNIHGGPYGQALYGWNPWIQYFVQRGYLVLEPNHRGSSGYGRGFMERLYGDWGGGEVTDAVAGVEAVIATGLVDSSRVIVAGGSAGGYSALMCLIRAPETFKAGICRYGIADLAATAESTWSFERYYIQKLMGGPGGRRSELYRERSPIYHAEKLSKPLLILHGEEDVVCPPSQIHGLVDRLRGLGRLVEYHAYPGEGHGWRRVATIADDARRSDDFLTRMVLNR